MVDLTLFATRSFSSGVVVVMLWAFGLFGIYFFTAIYLQSVLGLSASVAGLAFVPMAVLMAVGATVSDRIVSKVGAHRLISAAMLLMSAGIVTVGFFGAHATFGDLMIPFAMIGIGGGLTIPLTSVIVSGMPEDSIRHRVGRVQRLARSGRVARHHSHRRGAHLAPERAR